MRSRPEDVYKDLESPILDPRLDPEYDKGSFLKSIATLAASLVAIRAGSYALKKTTVSALGKAARNIPPIRKSALDAGAKNLADDMSRFVNRLDTDVERIGQNLASKGRLESMEAEALKRGWKYAKTAPWELPVVYGVNEVLYKNKDGQDVPSVNKFTELLMWDIVGGVIAPVGMGQAWKAFSRTPAASMFRKNLARYGESAFTRLNSYAVQGARYGTALSNAIDSSFNDIPSRDEMGLKKASKHFWNQFRDGWDSGKERWDSRINNLSDVQTIQRFRSGEIQSNKAWNQYLTAKYQAEYIRELRTEAAGRGISLSQQEATDAYESIIRGASATKHTPKNLHNWLTSEVPLEQRKTASNWFRDRFSHTEESLRTTQSLLRESSPKIASLKTDDLEDLFASATSKADRKFHSAIVGNGGDVYRAKASINEQADKFIKAAIVADTKRATAFNPFGIRRATIGEYEQYVLNAPHMTPRAKAKMSAFSKSIEGTGIDKASHIADPWIFKTQSGGILDFSFVPSVARRVGISLEKNTQIPVLGFNPLQLIQQDARLRAQRSGYVSWISAGQRQPLFSDSILETPYLKVGEKIWRAGLSRDNTTFSKMPGVWKPFIVDQTTAMGRAVQGLFGMPGELRDGPPPGKIKGRFPKIVKALGIDSHSSGSIPNIMKRWFTGGPAWNLAQFAEKRGWNNVANRLYKMVPDNFFPKMINTIKSGDVKGMSPEMLGELDTGLTRMAEFFHPSLPKRAVKDLMGGKLAFGPMYDDRARSFVVKEAEQLKKYDIDDVLKLTRTGNKDDLQEALRIISGDARSRQPYSGDVLSNAFNYKLQGHYRDIGVAGEKYLQAGMPGSTFAVGETYVVDKVQRDIVNYLLARPALMLSGKNEAGFLAAIRQIDEYANEIAKRGKYGRKLADRLRGSVIGAKMIAFRTRFPNKEMRMGYLAKDTQLVGELESLAGQWANSTKGLFSLSDDQVFKAARVNRFGSDFAYLPTFQSALNEEPLAAMQGLLFNKGIKSNASVASYYMVQRLGSVFEKVGLGFEPGRFKSAANLLVNGFILRRFLPAMAVVEAYRYLDWQAEDKTGTSISELGMRMGLVEPTTFAAGVSDFLGGDSAARWFGKVTGEEDRMNFLKYARMGSEEMREFWNEGDVPIKKGRWWLLSSSPFEGGRTQYYAPNAYRRVKSRYRYTWQGGAGPEEEYFSHSWLSNPSYPLAPLQRLLDPYWFEKGTYHSRPYMQTGEFFTGPYGPVGPMLNATIGQIIKPTRRMHPESWNELSTGVYADSGKPIEGVSISAQMIAASNQQTISDGVVASVAKSTPIQPYGVGIENTIALYQQFGISPAGLMASTPGSTVSRYPTQFAAHNQTISRPVETSTAVGETLYRAQEMAGIYGFSLQTLRQKFGLEGEYAPQARISKASDAYGFGHRFWGLNLGGMGDVTLPVGTDLNFTFSEIFRRFIPDEFGGNQVNTTRNDLWEQFPWLPGPYSNYMRDYSKGDPYALDGANMLMPGDAYERLYGDSVGIPGVYDWQDQIRILCLHPDTLIRKSGSRNVRIDNIKSEDTILCHEGSKEKVLAVQSKYINEDLYKIQTVFSPGIQLKTTWNHPIFVKENIVSPSHKYYSKKAKNKPAKFKKAIEITTKDFIGFPVINLSQEETFIIDLANFCYEGYTTKIENDIEYIHIKKRGCNVFVKRYINIYSKEFMQFSGMYLAEGCCNDYCVVITPGNDKKHKVKDLISCVIDLLGITPYNKLNEDKTCYEIRIKNSLFSRFIGHLFGTNSHDKTIPDILFNKNIIYLMEWYMRGDGCIYQNRNNKNEQITSAEATSISQDLILALWSLAISIGIPGSYQEEEKTTGYAKENRQRTFKIRWSGSKAYDLIKKFNIENEFDIDEPDVAYNKLNSYFYSDGFCWFKVKSVETFKYSGLVYDICVENKHTILTACHAVHNSSMSPWSPEFKSVMRGAARRTKTPEQEEFYRDAKMRAEDINNKYRFAEYRYNTNLELKKNQFTVSSITDEGLIYTNEIPEPIRLAGVQEGSALNKFLLNKVSPGQKIDVTTDLGRARYTMDQQDRVIEGIVGNLSKEAIDYGVEERIGGSPLDYYARTNAVERGIGATWERFSHMWNPLTTKFLNRRTALEQYERGSVYGKEFAPWGNPWESFVEPQFTSIETKSAIGAITGGTILGAMFGRTNKARAILGIAGGLTAAATKAGMSAYEKITGKRYVPGDVKKQWETEEYVDILTYTHRARVYNALRKRALAAGEEDPESYWSKYEYAKSAGRQKNAQGELSQLSGYAVPSEAEFAKNNPMSGEAVKWRKSMASTLYGADPYGDLSSIYKAYPKSRRPFLESFLNARKEDREKILKTLPLLERRVMEAHWGMQVEALPSLDKYFSKHHLPPSNAMFWNPNLDMDKMKIKIMEKSETPLSDFGYYPQEAAEANLYPIPAPDPGKGSSIFDMQQHLHSVLSDMGMYGINMSISPSNEPGYNFAMDITQDITDQLRSYLDSI
jgi:hypothetical protein